MSHGPSTFGTMTTSSRSPISLTSRVRSSRTHGDSSEFTRAHRAVSPRSISRPTRISPSRAVSLRSTGTASSRLPSRMSTSVASSGAFATIRSFEKSRKWIIRDGLKGISRRGSGAPMASGRRKSLGLRMGRGNLPAVTIPRRMTDTQTKGIETTEADDHLFCLITMNHHPLHINDVYAAESQQGRNVVVGPLVYSLALGMSVADISGKAIANLATEELSHPAPVFHGDTLFAETEVLEVRESRSKPDRGTVKVHTRVLNQDGVLVAEFKRLVLVPRRQPGPTDKAEANVE